MAHCPNTVEGVETSIKDVPGGVELTVTTKTAAMVGEIRTRAKFLVDAAKAESGTPKHNGTGQGGGIFGRCPIVMKDTSVEAADVDGGSKVTVKTKTAAEVDWVRREARERQAELAAPGGRDAGGRKMAHCPSAVDGASTSVKNTKDGVEVTVTAKSADATKEIRERAKHLVEAAKKDPSAPKHDGSGEGGGGLGRCPVPMKDTSIDAKDVDGGSRLTVKPTNAADLTLIQKEAKERAERFASPGGAGAASASPSAAPAAPPKKPTP
jgi:TusA-related sulfurtransferase